MLKFHIKKIKIFVKKIIGRRVSLEEMALSYIGPDTNVLEAGANDGSDTKRLASFTKNMVFAFEPVPSIFETLRKNTAEINNINVFPYALGDKNTSAPMYISSGASDGSSSLLKPAEHLAKNPEVVFDETIEVKVVTLDNWASDNRVNKIDFMWLDMQGYEYSMLRASKTVFPKVKILYTEVSTEELYAGQGLYPEYKEWLLKSGFKLIKENLPWGFTGNALFIRK